MELFFAKLIYIHRKVECGFENVSVAWNINIIIFWKL